MCCFYCEGCGFVSIYPSQTPPLKVELYYIANKKRIETKERERVLRDAGDAGDEWGLMDGFDGWMDGSDEWMDGWMGLIRWGGKLEG